MNRVHWTSLSVLLGVFGAAGFGSVLLLVSLAHPRGEEARHPRRPADFPAIFAVDHALDGLPEVGSVGTRTIFIEPLPPFDKDMFPCSQCHDNKDLASKPEPRPKLRDPHENHTVKHGTLWCLACHDSWNKDKLHLSDGQLLDLADPLRLCAQCHGEKARDWESGVHGHRTGYWDGPKRVQLCVACHDPHHPRFKAIEPLPPPVRPGFNGGPAKEKS